MFEQYGRHGPTGLERANKTLPSSAKYKPYSRSAVAKKRKGTAWGKGNQWRGATGRTQMSLGNNKTKQPIGAKPTSTKPNDSLHRQKWFQT